MKQRDITTLSILAPMAIAALCMLGLLALFALSGCAHVPGPSPDDPDPPPNPDAGPGATDCERAELQSRYLQCSTEAEAAAWVDACERYSSLGSASSWHAGDCMRWAGSCEQLEACRGGQ
jgi:hypothetical protein